MLKIADSAMILIELCEKMPTVQRFLLADVENCQHAVQCFWVTHGKKCRQYNYFD